MNNEVAHIKHLEACKRWRERNPERRKEVALAHIRRKKAANPEEYKKTSDERAKRYRLANLEKSRQKERENSRRLREKDKDAYNLQQRLYRRNNKEKFDRYYQKFKEKNRVLARAKLLKKYNLTQELFDKMLFNQEGKCAICKVLFENTRPNIDHSHETGRVRGLLCSPCNIVLGYVEKNQVRVADFYGKFTEYLK